MPWAAAAQPHADPLDARAAVAPATHRSLLSTYRRLDAESKPLAWRDANDQVERIGGWRAYAREANVPAPASPAAPAPPTAAASAAPAPEASAAPVGPAPSAPRTTQPAAPAPAHRH